MVTNEQPTIPEKLPLPMGEMWGLVEMLQAYKQLTKYPDEIQSTINLIAREWIGLLRAQHPDDQTP